MKIPDAHDGYNETYDLLKYSHIKNQNPWSKPYWFVNKFNTNTLGKKKWLNFAEINYRAEVWLNGVQLADTSKMVGMERSFRFDVTDIVKENATNILAVAIYPLDSPGEPGLEPLEPFGDPGVNMGDGLISLNYSKWDAVGWDWQPAVRDRDMGITEDVFLSFTDDIEVNNLYISSEPQIPEATFADMIISFDIVNHSNETKDGFANISIEIDSENISLNIPFVIKANETKSFLLNNDITPQLKLQNPKLWWPAGYGHQNLYSITIAAHANQGDKSAITELHGIRKVETYMGSRSRVFKINGVDVFMKGGNWVLDMMLNWTSSRYEKEILLSRNANLNLLRVWGPTGVPPKAMYKYADKYGILMWQDFLNDYWGTFRNTPGYIPDREIYEIISKDIVKRYRNHPSLIIWCGGNEGVNPREDLLVNTILAQHDNRTSRVYLKQSDGDGLHGGGPYHTIRPSEYFGHERMYGFSSEIGPSGVPVIQSVLRFMPQIGQKWKENYFPIDGVWAYHDAANFPGDDLRKFTSYDNIVRKDYGGHETEDMQGIINYFAKSQMINYDVYRASISAINRQMWNGSTGMLLWKSNSSWPSMVWQIYDWYLQSHAGYYATQKTFAQQVVQLNRNNNSISVINSDVISFDNVTVNAVIYDANNKPIWKWNTSINLNQNSAIELDSKVPALDELHFLSLELKNQHGDNIADNFYWLHKSNDFSQLAHIGEPELSIDLSTVSDDCDCGYFVTVSNKSNIPAIMVKLSINNKLTGHEILPALWSDNYISLLPGQSKHIEVSFVDYYDSEEILLNVKPFNMGKTLKVELN
jgi:hypothetical protein